MAKLLISLLAIILVIHTSSAKYLKYMSYLAERNALPVSRGCQDAISSAETKCNQNITRRWINSKITNDLQHAILDLDQAKIKLLTEEIECCSSWQAVICLAERVEMQCSANDQKTLSALMGVAIGILTDKVCKDIPFGSPKCEELPDSQPKSSNNVLSSPETQPSVATQAFSSLYRMSFTDSIPDLSVECSEKFADSLKQCNQTVIIQWLESGLAKEIVEAVNNKDLDQLDQLQKKVTCCIGWDVLDCVDASVLQQCTAEDQKVADRYLDIARDYMKNNQCQSYLAHSSKCAKN